MTANNRQVAGNHYRTQYQHWDFAWNCRLNYFAGQITKYLSRHTTKKGLEDVQKAIHFIEKYSELLRTAKEDGYHPVNLHVLNTNLVAYFGYNPHLGELERQIITRVTLPHAVSGLSSCVLQAQMIADSYAKAGAADGTIEP